MGTSPALFTLYIFRIVLIVAIMMLLLRMGYIISSFRKKVPFVPTPRRVIRKMVAAAKLREGQTVIDLGSGTGAIIMQIGKTHAGVDIVGIEHSPLLRCITFLRLLVHPGIRKRVTVLRDDFFTAQLLPYAAVFCFLTPDALLALRPKFDSVRTGCRIISYLFPLQHPDGFSEEALSVGKKEFVYVYTKL